MRYFAVITFTLCFACINSQNLAAILRSKKEIRTKCAELQASMQRYTETNVDSAILIARVQDSLASTSKDYDLISNSKWSYAIISNSKPEESLRIAYENLSISNASGNCKLITKAYLLLARVNWFIRNDQKVFENFDRAILEAEKCKDKELLSVCPKTRCLDGKIQFRGVLKKMIVRFTGVNERLFFLTQRRKWSFRPNTTYQDLQLRGGLLL